MKILLLVFIVYFNYSLSQATENNPTKKNKVHPKKFRTGLLLYNNAGKYIKSSAIPVPIKRKEESPKAYTAFVKPYLQQMDDRNMNHKSVPNSPYFPFDHPEPHERRSRVKKVLPDFTLTRKKRSADGKINRAPSQLKVKRETRVKRLKSSDHRTEKREGGVKKLSSPVKSSSKIGRRGKKTNIIIKRGKVAHKGKTRVVSNTKIAANKKQKVSSRNRQLKNKRYQSKTLVSSNNKKLLHSAPAQKKLKLNHSNKRTQNLRNLKKKPPMKPQAQRNRTSRKRTMSRGEKGPDARRLISGRDALIEDYPYTVSIQKDKVHWCSGAILNPRLIITTANCLWRSKSISHLRVRAGSRDTGRGGQLARIQEVMKHPGWKLRRDPDNDVALAVLDRNIRFSHAVHGVDLPNRVMLPAFDDAWVTSWGTDRRDGVFSRGSASLQVYRARLMERDKCNNVTHRFGVHVSENFVCLAQAGKRAPCTRDTGAPAVSDGVLWGLASWGIRKLCGTERYPAMFSYLASQSNMDFIINATHLLMADERFYPFPDRYPLRKYPLTSSTAMTLPW